MRITADLGELIRNLRDARGITRRALAEQAGVSISHLEKIESGQRCPGMGTFIKIMMKLDVIISLHSTGYTVQEKCIVEIQEIVSDCTEGEARYLAHMVKYMAESFPLLVKRALLDCQRILGTIFFGRPVKTARHQFWLLVYIAGFCGRYWMPLIYIDKQQGSPCS